MTKYDVGSVFDTRESGKAEIVEVIDSKNVKIKFLSSGNEKIVCKANLLNGRVKDAKYFASIYKYKVGTTHKTKRFGMIEVIDYVNAGNVTVRFLNTGNTYVTTTSIIAEGKIADSIYHKEIYDYRAGVSFVTEEFGKYIITENIGTEKVKILFVETGTELVVSKEDALNKSIQDPANRTKRTSEAAFCVYLHKDKDGVVRYVGEGTLMRAYTFTRKDQPRWESVFKDNPPEVELVAENLTKHEAEILELQYRELHEATIVNYKHAKKTPHIISYNFVSKFVYYDETSPTFLRWKVHRKNNAKPDSPAGYFSKGDYVTVEINNTSYAVHRIVWTLFNGDFDAGLVVDHINGNKQDNSIQNLRLVSHKENSRNKLLPIPPSGYRCIREDAGGFGVRWTEDSGRKFKSFSLRNFQTKKDCLKAAYNFRESLIISGLCTPRIKEGEEPIE